MQIDIGFGDVITPGAIEIEYPTLLEFPVPRLRSYPKETVIAEKLEALTALGVLNSRMKDYFDLWALSRMFDFNGATLVRAIKATFQRRGVAIESLPAGLQKTFAEEKSKQWTAFTRRCRLSKAPEGFEDIVRAVNGFAFPVLAAAAANGSFDRIWPAGGPWPS